MSYSETLCHCIKKKKKKSKVMENGKLTNGIDKPKFV